MKIISSSIIILLVLTSCGEKEKKRTVEKIEFEKDKIAVAEMLMKKYSIKNSFDTVKIRYSMDFDSEIGRYQMVSNNTRVIDLYKEGSINYVSLSVGIPRKYLKLTLSNSNLKELLKIGHSSGYIFKKILIIKINKMKRGDFVFSASPAEEYGYTVELSDHTRDFFGEGELIEIVSIQ